MGIGPLHPVRPTDPHTPSGPEGDLAAPKATTSD
jgi:hypothetical protein